MSESPYRPVDDDARKLARELLDKARVAALGVIDAQTGAPMVSRIAVAAVRGAGLLSLMSSLSRHHGALVRNPACSLLIGEPPDKGDPLAFPRITLMARAELLPDRDKTRLRDRYLATHPKAALYFDFSDFGLVRFRPAGALLNGGFGKAFELEPNDLT